MKRMTVGDVMTKLVVKLYPKDSIRDAAMKLTQNNISGAPVLQDKTIVGIVSETDLVRAARPSAPSGAKPSALGLVPFWWRGPALVEDSPMRVEDVMTRRVVTVSAEANVWDAAALMERHQVKRLPVADPDGRLVGIISRADVVRAMARDDEAIRSDVIAAIHTLGDECTSGIRVQFSDGVATLRGRADRRSTKEIAARLASQVTGVIEVVDRVEFEYDDGHTKPPRPSGDPWAVGPLVKLA